MSNNDWDKWGKHLSLAKDVGKELLHQGKDAANHLADSGRKAWSQRQNYGRATWATGAAAVGASQEAVKMANDLSSHLRYSDDKTQELQKSLQEQSDEYSRLTQNRENFDTIMIGGFSLAELLSQKVRIPEDLSQAYERAFPDLARQVDVQQALFMAGAHESLAVEKAFEEAYPVLARDQSLREAIVANDQFELTGLVSGIKGKLFEMKYVDYLNSGDMLPDTLHAELADSPTQSGWDIRIVDHVGEVHKELQLKATDSVEYIHKALERYPAVDVVVPSETYQAIEMQGTKALNDFVDSGMSMADLEEQVHDYIAKVRGPGDMADLPGDTGPSMWQEGSAQIDTGIPLLSLGIIAFSEYRRRDEGIYGKSLSFGERSAKAYASYVAGALAIAAVPSFWFVGIFAAMGVRHLLKKGEQKRRIYQWLKQKVKINQRIIDRIKAKQNPTWKDQARQHASSAFEQVRRTWHKKFREQ